MRIAMISALIALGPCTNEENPKWLPLLIPDASRTDGAGGATEDVVVTFQSATQTGGISQRTASTGLFLSFDRSPATLTAENITVTGATKGILIGPGTTMYLGISNITVENGATVSVTIASPTGYSISGSPKTAVVYRPPYVGLLYGGGRVCYVFQPGDPGYIAGETHGLIDAAVDLGTAVWALPANQSTAVPGGTSENLNTGLANTINILAQNGVETNHAAAIAHAHRGGGFTDWYLPSYRELERMYPCLFAWHEWYWSSSEYAPDNVRLLNMWYGENGGSGKGALRGVAAVRSF